MLTAYNYPVARCLEKAGIPVILVGDTVAMVEIGFDSTREVTVDHMQYRIAAFCRGAPETIQKAAEAFTKEVNDGTFVNNILRMRKS